MSGIGYDRHMQTFEYGNATTIWSALVAHALSACSSFNHCIAMLQTVTWMLSISNQAEGAQSPHQSRKIVFSCLVSLSVEEKDELGLSHTDCPMPQVHPLPQPGQTKFADVHPHSKVPLNRFPFQQLFVSNKSDDMNVAK